TSTGPKLSKTSSVHVPHPWRMRHFEGTDRSFALYVAFPHADYYAQSDCLSGLGVLSGISSFLLSTLLGIPCRLSRVRNRGHLPDGLGGVLPTFPSSL